jgi:tetratricopeptide (TPR) repeat protein
VALGAPALLQTAFLARHLVDRKRDMTLYQAARNEYDEVVQRRPAGESDPLGLVRVLVSLAAAAVDCRDLDTAWRCCMEARRRLNSMAEPLELVRLLSVMARVPVLRGDWASARVLLEEQLALCRQLRHNHQLIHSLGALGHVERNDGQYTRAEALYHESLLLRRDADDALAVAMAFEDIAALASRQGQHDRAARLLGAGEAFSETLDRSPPVADPPEYERAVADSRAALGEEVFAAAWAEGRAMPLDGAIQYALENAAGPPD